MKKILGLTIGLIFTTFTYAQNATFLDASDDYNKEATTEFHFKIDDSITKEKLEEVSEFYTDYFKVNVSDTEGGHEVEFVLNANEEMPRKVIMRYFVSLEQRTIEVNGEDMELRPFMKKYIEL